MTDIIDRLKEPEIHYPGNFDTPKRANAMLSCLCQEAAEEIDALRSEVERLKKSRQDALDAVRNELVAIGLLPTERGWLAHEGRKDCLTLESELMFMRESGYLHLLATREELAASQSREQQLREDFQTYIAEHEECTDADDWMAMTCSMEAHHVADEALTLPQDTTALEAMIAKAGEVMRKRALVPCDDLSKNDGNSTECRAAAGLCGIAIDALPVITLDDLK